MERIASFCVDHTTLLPGMYLSRRDGAEGEILTWDIRMKQPTRAATSPRLPPTRWSICLPPTRATANTARALSMSARWAA